MYVKQGTHIRFGGRGKLVGKQGLTMEGYYSGEVESKSRVKCLFYEPAGIDDIVTRVVPSSLAFIEPELAYPPLHPTERSRFFVKEWDITLAWSIIRKGRSLQNLDRENIESYYDQYLKGNDTPDREEIDENGQKRIYISMALASVDKEHALTDKVDLTIPSLWLKLTHKENSILLIDGRHRLYKAYHTGVQTLPAYILTPEEGQIISRI